MLIEESLTSASTGNWPPFTGLACATPAPVWPFPVTTAVKFMKAGKKAGRKGQKRRVGLVAFGHVPENFVARGLGGRTKGKSRASRFLACHENE